MPKKSPLVESLENSLNLTRAIKATLINVIAAETQKPPELDAKGRPLPKRLSEGYYKAVNELKGLMSKEAELLKAIEEYEPELDIEVPDFYYDERGMLQIGKRDSDE